MITKIKINKDVVVYQNNIMQNNTIVITNNDSVFVFDPSFDCSEIYSLHNNYKNKYVILTHGHYDHIGKVQELNEFCNHILLSSKMKQHINKLNQQIFFDGSLIDKDKLMYINDKQEFNDFKFYLTPGHSIDSMCIYYKGVLITGDHVFCDSIGRTDLPLSDKKQMIQSLMYFKEFIEPLNNDTKIISGHGEIVDKKTLLSINPFLA